MAAGIKKHFWSLLVASLYLVANSLYATEPEPIYYQDCAYLEFDNIDSETLTRDEEIALVDENFFAALDRTAECMNQAAAAGAGRIGDAAGSQNAGQSAGATGTAGAMQNVGDGSAPATQTEQSQTTQQTKRGDTSGIDTERDAAKSGSSAVCDAVKEGLAEATTQAEKTHWQNLKTEYGCQ